MSTKEQSFIWQRHQRFQTLKQLRCCTTKQTSTASSKKCISAEQKGCFGRIGCNMSDNVYTVVLRVTWCMETTNAQLSYRHRLDVVHGVLFFETWYTTSVITWSHNFYIRFGWLPFQISSCMVVMFMGTEDVRQGGFVSLFKFCDYFRRLGEFTGVEGN